MSIMSKGKANRVLNLLRRSLHGCSKTAKARTYTALVRPHLETCSPVWTPHQKQLKQSLENVQKRASRWVCAKWDASHFKWTKTYEECCNELNWQTIKQRHTMLTCCQVYKIVNIFDCLVFKDHFSYNNNNTRSSPASLLIPHARVNAYSFSFFVNSPHLLNFLPASIHYSSSYNTFKAKLSEYFH